MKIEKITLYNLEIPIVERYELSFGSIDSFQTSLVEIQSGNQRGIGETTPLEGYNWESNQSVWQFLMDFSPKIVGMDVLEARDFVMESRGNNYFAATAFCSALEFVKDDFFQNIPSVDIPLVGIVSGHDLEGILTSVSKQKEMGYSCVKVKVGGGNDVEKDVDKINVINKHFPEMPLRVDANKGYTHEEALYFVDQIQAFNIEEFEQPFPVDSWDEMEDLSKRKGKISLMLDETIDTLDELHEAIRRKCCDFVKFKLMKHSSIDYMFKLIETAKSAGLKVIIGNGVASDIGCYHEALIQAKMGCEFSGEMNGFLKQKNSILKYPLRFERGKLSVSGYFNVELNDEVIKRYLVKKETFT